MEGYSYTALSQHFQIPYQGVYQIIHYGGISAESARKINRKPTDPPMSRTVRMSRALDELPFFTWMFKDRVKACTYLADAYNLKRDSVISSSTAHASESRKKMLDKRRAMCGGLLDELERTAA